VDGLLVNGITTNRDIVKASGSGSKVKLVDTTFTDNIAGSVSTFFSLENGCISQNRILTIVSDFTTTMSLLRIWLLLTKEPL